MSRQSLNWIFEQLEQYSKTKGNFLISSLGNSRSELAGGEEPKSKAIFVLLPQILQAKIYYFTDNILPLSIKWIFNLKKCDLFKIISQLKNF